MESNLREESAKLYQLAENSATQPDVFITEFESAPLRVVAATIFQLGASGSMGAVYGNCLGSLGLSRGAPRASRDHSRGYASGSAEQGAGSQGDHGKSLERKAFGSLDP